MLYEITVDVTSTQGTQTFAVEADSPAAAVAKFNREGGSFIREAVEVMSFGSPEVTGSAAVVAEKERAPQESPDDTGSVRRCPNCGKDTLMRDNRKAIGHWWCCNPDCPGDLLAGPSLEAWECPNCGKPYDKRTACWCCISMEGRMWTSVNPPLKRRGVVDNPHSRWIYLHRQHCSIGDPAECEVCWVIAEIERLREEPGYQCAAGWRDKCKQAEAEIEQLQGEVKLLLGIYAKPDRTAWGWRDDKRQYQYRVDGVWVAGETMKDAVGTAVKRKIAEAEKGDA